MHPAKQVRPVDILNMDTQSTYILRSLADATRCVHRLVSEGYTVLSVHIGNRQPRVVIERSARCARLHGAMSIRFSSNAGRKEIMVAEIDDVQVQWCEVAP